MPPPHPRARLPRRSHIDHDTLYFAHCYPYTYSDLEAYLLELKQRPGIDAICRGRTLCKTLAGNVCHLLTITNYGSTSHAAMTARKGVVISARVHPGESNASWMMKGILDYLLSDTADAKVLYAVALLLHCGCLTHLARLLLLICLPLSSAATARRFCLQDHPHDEPW